MDSVAREAADQTFVGPEPFTGVPWCIVKACLRIWVADESKKYFLNCKGMIHSKRFIRELDKTRSRLILGLGRNETRLVTAAYTGRHVLNDFLFKIGLREDDKCRFCGLVKETMQHILCECDVQGGTRYRNFKRDALVPEDLNRLGLRKIVKFLKDIGI